MRVVCKCSRRWRPRSLAEGHGFMALAQAFRATGKFMEQEMILDE